MDSAIRIGIGLVIGLLIAAIDNLAFGGEVSPILILVMLIAAAATTGAMWGARGWAGVLAIWFCIPLAHLVKHLSGMPDTLHPNSYASILVLAIVTLAVTLIGAAGGMLGRHLASSK